MVLLSVKFSGLSLLSWELRFHLNLTFKRNGAPAPLIVGRFCETLTPILMKLASDTDALQLSRLMGCRYYSKTSTIFSVSITTMSFWPKKTIA